MIVSRSTVRRNWVDRAIEPFAPTWAAKRLRARAFLAVAGGYAGASRTRETLSGWNPGAGSADEDTIADLPTLRARSRDLARNAPIATGAIAGQVTHVIGTGLSLQSDIDAAALGMSEEQAADWRRTTEREFEMWAESIFADVCRRLTFYGLQDLAFRSHLESGDAFALLTKRESPGWPYRFAVQMIEADRVSNPGRARDTEKIVGGVELDAFGAAVRFHVASGHPDSMARNVTWSSVPAFVGTRGRRGMLHLVRVLRPGQTRGVPLLAPVIEALKQLSRYSDAELAAAVNTAVWSIFVKMDPQAFTDTFDTASRELIVNQAKKWDGTLKPGAAINLLPGEEIQQAAALRPNVNFDPFVASVVRQIGVALEIPYEVLVQHFQSSYSAARAALLAAWRVFRVRRDWMATHFCQPIYEAWLEEAVALGRIDAPGYLDGDAAIRRAWARASWIGDGPGSIDPVKEVNAAEKRIDLGISTRSEETILHDGGDWETKHAQRVREEEMRRRDGLADAPTSPAPSNKEVEDEAA